MRLRLTAQAERDLDDIWLYIAADDIDTADRFVDSLYRTLYLIGEQPRIGRSRAEVQSGLYRFPVGNYIVFYLVDSDVVEIVRVLHGARDIETELDVEPG